MMCQTVCHTLGQLHSRQGHDGLLNPYFRMYLCSMCLYTTFTLAPSCKSVVWRLAIFGDCSVGFASVLQVST